MEVAQELATAVMTAAKGTEERNVWSEAPGSEERHWTGDTQWEAAMVPLSIAMQKVLEARRTPTTGRNFKGVRVAVVKTRENKDEDLKGSVKVSISDDRGLDEEIGRAEIRWGELPYITEDGKRFRYCLKEQTGAGVKIQEWLKQPLFKLEITVGGGDEGRGSIMGAYLPPEGHYAGDPRESETVVHEYNVEDLIQGYRNEIAAHFGSEGGKLTKNRALRAALREGPYKFRIYIRSIMVALAQNLLVGMYKSDRQGKAIRRVLGTKIKTVSIEFDTGTALGLPEKRWETIPKRVIVGGAGKTGQER